MLHIFKAHFPYIEILDFLIKQWIKGAAMQLKRPRRKERFESDNCIPCEKSEKIVTTPNGRAKILDAAIVREDSNILNQIKSLDNVDDLNYHIVTNALNRMF